MKSIDSVSKKYLNYLYKKGYANLPDLPLEEARALFSTPSQSSANSIISIPYSDTFIPLNIYKPKLASDRLIIFFHGGGYVIRNHQQMDKICQNLCTETSSYIVSVEYSLSPEKKFPYAILESNHALEYLSENPSLLGEEIKSVFLCGESSGGNLATALALFNKELSLNGLILITPSLDYYNHYLSKENYKNGYLLDENVRAWFADHYLSSNEERINPLVSPVLSNDLCHFPRTIILSAYFDPLRDETDEFLKILNSHAIQVQLFSFDTIHGFLGMDIHPFSKEAYEKIKFFTNQNS